MKTIKEGSIMSIIEQCIRDPLNMIEESGLVKRMDTKRAIRDTAVKMICSDIITELRPYLNLEEDNAD